MKKKHYLLSIILTLTFSWFLATIFIDFFAVPNVFRTVSTRAEAASLGVIIFSKFNLIECILATILVFVSLRLLLQKLVTRKTFILPIIFLIIFPITYTFIFSPNIKFYNNQKIELGEDTQTQEKLDLYHKLYVRADSAKLLALLYVIVYSNILMLAKED